jgi:hypothetical protein
MQKGYRTKFISSSRANDENQLQQMDWSWSKTLETILLYWCVVLNSMNLSANLTGNFIPAIIGAGMYIFGTGQACIFYVQGIRPHYFTVFFIVMQ